MPFPITGNSTLFLALIFGAVFGFLLQRGRVTYYDVIVNQFRFKDFTVLKVMLSAVLAGGLGIWALQAAGLAQYHIKPADLLGVTLGAAIFGVGMVLYGYCPGTGVAAVAQGSLHALVGFGGMLIGGIMYALAFQWVKDNILSVWSLGKVRLPDISGVPDPGWFVLLLILAGAVFYLIERHERRNDSA